MKKIYNLDEFHFDEGKDNNKRAAKIRVHLKYVDVNKVVHMLPSERKKAVDKHFRDGYSKLLKIGIFDTVKLIGNEERPTGVESTVLFGDIQRLARYRFIDSIFVKSVKGAKRKVKGKSLSFFCVRMTAAIQVEGMKKGFQTYEERFVFLTARSPDDAYKKVKRQAKKYGEPYLNSDGQLVRWMIESLDDCYAVGISSCDDLNKPEGVEVYSALKRRRLTKERIWDGEL
jgi:hypothetical protein